MENSEGSPLGFQTLRVFCANFRKSLFSNGLKINKKRKIFVANGAGRCSSLFRQSKQVMSTAQQIKKLVKNTASVKSGSGSTKGKIFVSFKNPEDHEMNNQIASFFNGKIIHRGLYLVG